MILLLDIVQAANVCPCLADHLLGSGGFFLVCEDFGRMLDNLFPACGFFSCFLFFFYTGD